MAQKGREKERPRIRAMKMNNIRGLLGVRRLYRIPNARVRELCSVKKRLDKRIGEMFSDGLAIWKE